MEVNRLTAVLAVTLLWMVVLLWTWPSEKMLKLVFCDVGQGDAALWVLGSMQVLVDGGPLGGGVLDCLSSQLPFWDRQIEIVWLTHPQADHMDGLVEVLSRYQVKQIIVPEIKNETKGYERFETKMLSEGAEVLHLYRGDKLIINEGLEVEVLWPGKHWLNCCFPGDLNLVSNAVVASFGEFRFFTSGDLDLQVEHLLLERDFAKVVVMKVPHHGSRTGMSERLLSRLDPDLAVISVGKKNKYGHPADNVLQIFEKAQVKVLRTDLEGDIAIASDGVGAWVVK